MTERPSHDPDRRKAGTQALGSRDAASPDRAREPEDVPSPNSGRVGARRAADAPRPVVPGMGVPEEPEEIDPEDSEMIGQVVDDRYRVTGLLGRGAMGSVYRAEHVTIRRPVALKLLHASLVAVPEISARFEREAFAIGRIDHPNCITVSDFGKLPDGSLFLVLELLHGRPLGDVLDVEGTFAPGRALHVVRHVLRGLAHAHRAGIVHRDVKPENVVLTEREDDADFAKILDFGIAKLVGQAETAGGGEKLTQAGIAFGTPAYMSPEQVVGETADARSDIYSAGVMLFELLTGEPPFDGEDKVEVLTMHTSRAPPTLSDRAPDADLPLGAETMVRRALSKKREDRFETAEAFIAAIDDCLGDGGGPRAPTATDDRRAADARGEEAAPARAESATVRPGALRRATRSVTSIVRRRRVWPRVLAATLALAVSAAAGWWFVWRDRGPSEVSIAAATQLRRGNPAGAVAILEQKDDDIDDDPHAQLQLGHARAARREHVAALEAYERALALDGALRDSPELRTNLDLMLDAEAPPVVLAAADLLVRELRVGAAADRLVSLASSAKRPALRHGALALAGELGLADAVDRAASFALDLRQGETCEARREAVAKLRALGNPEAIPALRQAANRGDGRRPGPDAPGEDGRGQNGAGQGDGAGQDGDNACLREDAEEAVRYLASLSERTAPDAAPEPRPSSETTASE